MSLKRLTLFSLIGLISFVSGGWLIGRTTPTSHEAYANSRLLDEVVSLVSQYYVDSLRSADLYDLAIDGMLDELGDPYTSFLRRDALSDLDYSTTGDYSGLGIRIDVRDGWITIVSPMPGSPAERVGLQPGDRIVRVEGESTHNWNEIKAIRTLKGPSGTSVNIGVARPGVSEIIPFEVDRAVIHVSSVEVRSVVEGDIGYANLNPVAENSGQELLEAVAELRQRGATKLILDLRGNPGGLLDQAVAVSDLFLERGKTVVETRGRAPNSSGVNRTQNPAAFADMPVVVLVNQFTASAAEIIAGALQDHDRAVLVGTQTYGKGVAQFVFRIGEDQALRVTTSRWYTPLGRAIDGSLKSDSTAEVETFTTPMGREVRGGGGINPDVVVEQDSVAASERMLAQSLGSNVTRFRDAINAVALEYKARSDAGDPSVPDSPDFEVTDAMVEMVRAELAEREVEIPAPVWNAATYVVARELGSEMTRYLFGRSEARNRSMSRDPQMQAALEILRSAETASDVFATAN